ncbi:MAG: hypothetical protein R3293_06050 [Candidatus Promineifilaceae bacterium]|nr:hypothetical protein [Candidatus Promineifilaceae bacterium]
MITKRQLGYFFVFIGLVAISGSFLFDLAGGGQFQGIGPAQKLGLIAAAILLITGLSLLPLGDRPA